ncbi:MAG: arylesterase [Steroidobacterales bacterium]
MARVIGILLALLCMPAVFPVGAASEGATVLVFGDSVSAGYGIRVDHGWVQLLAQRIEAEGYGFRVVNASVSGETTAGGLARLPRALDTQRPRIVVLELGGNDGLRGLPLEETRSNLDQMIRLAQAHGARVLLIGMRIPPNYGERYTDGFQALYRELAAAHKIELVPFLMDKVAQVPGLMQADGIHPTEPAQAQLLENVWPKLLPLLRAGRAGAVRAGAARADVS